MTRRVRIGVVTVMVALLVAAAMWLVLGRSGGAQAVKPTTPSTQSSVVPPAVSATPSPKEPKMMLTADEAATLASDLVSADTTSYRSAWYDTAMTPPEAPAGTKLMIDTGTFQSQAAAGKVNAVVTLPGKSPETWRLLLLRKNNHWLVYTMEEVK